MAAFNEYEHYDAIGLAELVRIGDVTPKELLEAAIERVEERNPALNAVVLCMYEEAHRLIQKGLPQGPFRGVPFLIKDFGLFYKGITTSFGSRLFRNFVPDHHSTIVKRYLQSGLVI
ncbi:MAG: amidase, partial [Desulfobacteraceae bacterium]